MPAFTHAQRKEKTVDIYDAGSFLTANENIVELAEQIKSRSNSDGINIFTAFQQVTGYGGSDNITGEAK